jgi:hypothetical protein
MFERFYCQLLLPFIRAITTPIRKIISMPAGSPARLIAQVGWLVRRYQERPTVMSRKNTRSKLEFVRIDSRPDTNRIRMSIVQAIQKSVVIVLILLFLN